jgi:hypothetical protein
MNEQQELFGQPDQNTTSPLQLVPCHYCGPRCPGCGQPYPYQGAPYPYWVPMPQFWPTTSTTNTTPLSGGTF